MANENNSTLTPRLPFRMPKQLQPPPRHRVVDAGLRPFPREKPTDSGMSGVGGYGNELEYGAWVCFFLCEEALRNGTWSERDVRYCFHLVDETGRGRVGTAEVTRFFEDMVSVVACLLCFGREEEGQGNGAGRPISIGVLVMYSPVVGVMSTKAVPGIFVRRSCLMIAAGEVG